MGTVPAIAVAFVAALHLVFFALESFFWERPLGRKVFGHGREQARATRVLALNQGVYNGFLAVGLVWSIVADAPWGKELATFFLACVVVAGLVGGLTAARSILAVQAAPAAVALALVLAG